MSPMTLQAVPVRIPTERENAADVEVSNGGLPTIPTEARMLPQAPLHRATGVSGQEDHLGVPFEVAEVIEVGDLIALPDAYGRPWATFEVLAEVGPWAEAFPVPDDMPGEGFSDWVHFRVAPARDRLTIAAEAAQRATTYWEMRHAHERASAERYRIRRAAECAEIADRLKRADGEQIARLVNRLYDDEGRKALLDALARAEQEAVEQEAPVAA